MNKKGLIGSILTIIIILAIFGGVVFYIKLTSDQYNIPCLEKIATKICSDKNLKFDSVFVGGAEFNMEFACLDDPHQLKEEYFRFTDSEQKECLK